MLFQRPDQLLLTTGELFPTSRLVNDDVEATEMTGVEHLGQYVFEMSQAKLEAVRKGERMILAETNATADLISDEEEAVQDAEEIIDDDGFEVEEEGNPEESARTDKEADYPQ